MTEREQITASIKSKEEQIESLRKEIDELEMKSLILCDDKQWYKEEIESHPKPKRAKKPHWLDGRLVGRVYWKENFRDEDTGDVITIDRSRLVRVDNTWYM